MSNLRVEQKILIISLNFSLTSQTMRNLKVLDLKNNPLECNDDFRSTMKFLGSREVSIIWQLQIIFQLYI